MKLSLQTFSSIVANSAIAMQAASSQLLDVSTGSILRAILEANASIALWIQWLLYCILNATRASTSSGDDLDTWMADFNLLRLPPITATGEATLSRFSNTDIAVVPTGTLVKTIDGSQTFSVTIDSSNAYWDDGSNGYVLKAGVSQCVVPVVAQTAGAGGNVSPGTLTILASAVVGIDSVSNDLATSGGADAETDDAFRLRFTAYINSRSRATMTAVKSAIAGVQQGLSFVIRENVDGSGAPQDGSFLIIVDDGSGTPSQALLAAVYSAVDAVRPIGSIFAIQGPTVVEATIQIGVKLSLTSNSVTVVPLIQQRITVFVNALPIGASLPITRIAQLAYDADPGVVNVSAVQLNGSTSDLTVGNFSVLKVANTSVSIQ
jgi:uncharacterized phage protein gp47/JayE